MKEFFRLLQGGPFLLKLRETFIKHSSRNFVFAALRNQLFSKFCLQYKLNQRRKNCLPIIIYS